MATTSTTAFLFPGQGAQHVGMGADVLDASPAARAVFAEADDALGSQLSKAILEGPAEELVRTDNAQPAILCVSIAMLRAMKEHLGARMPTPTYLAGHSLGEYTALVAAGSIDLATGLRLVKRRGELMQAASEATPSGMAAVLGLPLNDVRQVCEATGAQVANVNSEGQTVIAGPREALERAIALAQDRGARRAIALDVAGAFHTKVMRPAQEEMSRLLADVTFAPPSVPIIANTTAGPMTSAEGVRDELANQLCSPVLWQESVELMAAQGVRRFIELGPGKVLSGLARRIAPDAEAVTVGDLDALRTLTVS